MRLRSVGVALGAGAIAAAGVATAGLAGGMSVHGYTITTGTTGTIPTITVPTVPTTTVPTTPTTTVPPTSHDCVFTGAGKDGQPGNDDCAAPAKPAVVIEAGTSQVVCPPSSVVTQTVTVTRTVQGPVRVQTKTVNHVRTRTVYRTRTIVKVKKIYVPGMHRKGVEGSG